MSWMDRCEVLSVRERVLFRHAKFKFVSLQLARTYEGECKVEPGQMQSRFEGILVTVQQHLRVGKT